LPETYRAEFTGERVIPGSVEDNLFSEHLARYRFTAHLVRSLGLTGQFLDAGCGAGYGTTELAATGAEVLGIDVSEEAVAHARANYAGRARFEQASCTAIPAADAAFRLITAFEVIEHIPDWREFLMEARRVLEPAGFFLVSTPNRLYYAESREKAGPNPFHVHEFTADEFHQELNVVFPHVKMLLQNHVEGIAFSGADGTDAAVEISERRDDPDSAHFFLAICGVQPLPPIAPFVFVPDAGNVLQTRERHIALLDSEIAQKNQWIETEKIARATMIQKVSELEAELEQHNRWAKAANEEAERRARLVFDLQAELRSSNEKAARDIEKLQTELQSSNQKAAHEIDNLQSEIHHSNEWARARDAEAEERGRRIVELQDEIARATEWAQGRDADAEERGRRVVELQDELAREQANSTAALSALQRELATSSAGYEAAIAQWRRDKEASDRWALETERHLSVEREALSAKQIEFEIAQDRIVTLQAEVAKLNARVTDLQSRMAMIAQSRWVRLGRIVRVGPEIQKP